MPDAQCVRFGDEVRSDAAVPRTPSKFLAESPRPDVDRFFRHRIDLRLNVQQHRRAERHAGDSGDGAAVALVGRNYRVQDVRCSVEDGGMVLEVRHAQQVAFDAHDTAHAIECAATGSAKLGKCADLAQSGGVIAFVRRQRRTKATDIAERAVSPRELPRCRHDIADPRPRSIGPKALRCVRQHDAALHQPLLRGAVVRRIG